MLNLLKWSETMIRYKYSQHYLNDDYTHNMTVEYVLTMVNDTRSDTPTGPGVQVGCIHTATLAVCTVLVIFVLFLGCTGNGIVLFNALTTKRLRSNFDLLVINLAGADFIMCTCLSPIFLFLLFSDSTIPKVFCGSILFLGVTSGLLSLLSLVSISVHRYCRVVGRIKRQLNLTQTSAIVGVVWIISISLALGGTFHVTSSWKEEGPIHECQNVVNSGESVTSNFVLYFMSPVTMISLTVIGLCYGIIAKIVRTQGSNKSVVTPTRDNEYMDGMNCETQLNGNGVIVDKSVPTGGDAQPDNGDKAVTICFVVILTVSLCWGPLVMSQFIELVTGESIILYQVKLCGIALIFLNSALDPYLYGQTNSRIKHKYARLLYNFARCEYTSQNRTKVKRCDKTILEACPLKCSPPNQESNTALLCCHQYESPINYINHNGSCHGRYCRTTNYTQNILLLNFVEDGYITNLCTSQVTMATCPPV